MRARKATLRKVRHLATSLFESAVRLHEDSILLFEEDRMASALHTSALAIEETGKYFLCENIWFYNNTGSAWTEEQIEADLIRTYSHILKQRVFANNMISPRLSDPILTILQNGQLERIKQESTYAGFSRNGKRLDFKARVNSPSRRGFKKLALRYITLVNDFIVVLSLGIRKGVFLLDIPEIHDWLADPEFEAHFASTWTTMSAEAKRETRRLRKLLDD